MCPHITTNCSALLLFGSPATLKTIFTNRIQASSIQVWILCRINWICLMASFCHENTIDNLFARKSIHAHIFIFIFGFCFRFRSTIESKWILWLFERFPFVHRIIYFVYRNDTLKESSCRALASRGSPLNVNRHHLKQKIKLKFPFIAEFYGKSILSDLDSQHHAEIRF